MCSGLEGQRVTWSLDPCICRSSPLILTGSLSLLSPNRMVMRNKTVTSGQGWPPSMAVSLNLASAGLSILFHSRMQTWPHSSNLCSPTFSLRLTNSATWGGNWKRKAGNKDVSVYFQEDLWCTAWFHNGTTPSLSTKQKMMNLIFAHTYQVSVYLYICAYINICMYI